MPNLNFAELIAKRIFLENDHLFCKLNLFLQYTHRATIEDGLTTLC